MSSAVLFVLITGSVLAQQPTIKQSLELSAESEPVLTMGDVAITQDELDAHMERLPKEDRAQAIADMDRIDKLLQNLLLKKTLYEAARDNELLKNPKVTFRALYAAADILAEKEMERRIESRLLDDYEQQGRELFLSSPERFRKPPNYSFTHVLVSTSERSEAEAMQRILEVHEQVQDGRDLSELATEYSDDSASVKSGGAYKRKTLESLDSNFARALSRLESPGDLSGPVRSRFGWHIIRLDQRHEPSKRKWEDVREQAMQMARQRHESRISEAYINELLNSDEIKVVPGSIERFQQRHGVESVDAQASND